MKTAIEILENNIKFKKAITNENFTCIGIPFEDALRAMEDYAQIKVNELSKANVSSNEAIQPKNKKDGEVAVCSHGGRATPIVERENGTKYCNDCGKEL